MKRLLPHVALWALAASGCNLVFDMEEGKPYPTSSGSGGATATSATTAASSTSSTGVGGGMADWSCLGSVGPAQMDIPYVFHFVDGMNPATMLTANLCNAFDNQCLSPVATNLAPMSNGILYQTLGPSFVGYFDIMTTKYKKTLLEIGPPTDLPNHPQREMPMLTDFNFAVLALFGGIQEKALHGTVLMQALDCQGFPAAGVRLAVLNNDAETVPFYIVGTSGSTTATETDASGEGGFVNVPLGGATVETYIAATNKKIASADVHVREKTLTYLHLPPTPL